ncbi:DNA polymerase [Lederbergia sp. NSJ-179]|uniref:DNA polymerase n=1 Tax=Lederbergia sp. NSJ-179 TaxID=2931402 RepID=UPI001FD58ED0|nr:DNA polymerase [Lederbergia sp. NSJ-179]MCJ7839957.1 DNA polymerase [Lederbergia sp. NSJ-179]
MVTLSIDIETYSGINLLQTGVYKYVEDPDFEILLFAYAFNDDPVTVIDLTDFENVPENVMESLTDPKILKTAFNANFERTCIAKHFGLEMDPAQWQCSSVHALTLGLPNYLDGVAKAMKLDVEKDQKGKNLIKYFSVPCKPTKVNGGRTRNYPHHDPDKWIQYIEYCRQDVIVEREIRKKLKKFPIPKQENRLWQVDQIINDRGVYLDQELVNQAIACDKQYKERLLQRATDVTGLDNPNSLPQLKKWLKEKTGEDVKSVTKDTMPNLIEKANDPAVKEALELRQELGRTSVTKFDKMRIVVNQDSRVRGILQFYGANRTGRWAGRLVQIHNLRKNELPDLSLARELLKQGEFELLELLFGDIPDTLSQLLRPSFVPSPGNIFYVSDFSAIEARVIAWLADEKWRLDVFNSHGKIYEASAAAMFNVPIEDIDKSSPLRQKGKVSELALGYQGGPGALIQMGALDMGIDEEELPELVRTWRDANPKIRQLWYDTEANALAAVRGKTTVKGPKGVNFIYESGTLFIQLPSGRKLAYVRPRIQPHQKFEGKDEFTYEGPGSTGMERIGTYGGKLVENIVQAIARDCLGESLINLENSGYKTVMHVHDEAVLDVPIGKGSLEEVTEIMGRPVKWAKGLPLSADAYETDYYMKD